MEKESIIEPATTRPNRKARRRIGSQIKRISSRLREGKVIRKGEKEMASWLMKKALEKKEK